MQTSVEENMNVTEKSSIQESPIENLLTCAYRKILYNL